MDATFYNIYIADTTMQSSTRRRRLSSYIHAQHRVSMAAVRVDTAHKDFRLHVHRYPFQGPIW